MQKLDFYIVDKKYINILQKIDRRVPNMLYSKNDKFLCGAVFKINDINYYAPVSSSINNNHTFLIENEDKKVISCIKFMYMIPVPDNCIEKKKINEEINFKYKNLLKLELKYCVKNQDKIIKQAEKIYNLSQKENHWLSKNCVDFKTLEAVCMNCLELINENEIEDELEL